QKAKEKRTQARTARTDAPVCRNNCDPFETISSLFIKVIPFVNVGTSILLMHCFGQQKSQEGSDREKDRHLNPAGNGNRTRMASLEGWNFTIKLCPREDQAGATSRHCQVLFRFMAKLFLVGLLCQQTILAISMLGA